MVDVDNHEPVAPVSGGSALDIFRHQWELYRKFLTHDYLANAGAYAALRRFLTRDVARPFGFIDLACGDASGIIPALEGTQIARYRGVDLSPPALELARKNLEALACDVVLEEADFAAAMHKRRGPADIVWISLSLHHLVTAEKAAFMRDVRRSIGSDGALLIYEPTSYDGESRPAWLGRFEQLGRREWTALSTDEFEEAWKHVRTCDLPETVSGWIALGRDAGFASVRELYCAPGDLFRMFSYRV
jgi:ubiquinone/menaquinone biosynthesis C-methylase UbiE